MPITHELVDDTIQVAIEGELTIYTVAELTEALLPHVGSAPSLALDLSQVTEIDGAGVQWLAVIHRESVHEGTALRLTGQSQAVAQALQLCGRAAL
ncbi:STAS domain-containing protein [Pseudomonas sp. GD03842]|uniref:STAS domain-containing protein n=1 Tax=Pseudomonas sp. GD03842 TaxID=2975385 RepID=UPI00244C2A9E|nr:STAS domain-containing protein [Pseudomonas sp. GD03842]MDH0748778.1 STAS domain-containing protein [Pseudomonas sp. GD03842]